MSYFLLDNTKEMAECSNCSLPYYEGRWQKGAGTLKKNYKGILYIPCFLRSYDRFVWETPKYWLLYSENLPLAYTIALKFHLCLLIFTLTMSRLVETIQFVIIDIKPNVGLQKTWNIVYGQIYGAFFCPFATSVTRLHYMGKYSCEASSFFCYTEESNVPLEEPWR